MDVLAIHASCAHTGRADARTQLSIFQWSMLAILLALCAVGQIIGVLGQVVHGVLIAVFLLAAACRLAACASLAITPRRHVEDTAPPLPDDQLPNYTVILALYDEAAIVPQLIRAIAEIDYPRERLQIIAALEADDPDTLAAICLHGVAHEITIVLAGGAEPRTKPRALNASLAHATGDIVVVFDAEDLPAPMQLREASARFAWEGVDLAVVQAPLRVRAPAGCREIQNQFALEYAGHFEVLLPFWARIGAPFPLGGTSNHIRMSALIRCCGWDAWNVTEDADIGFCLARLGYRSMMLASATTESCPASLNAWIRQRGRWLKGHMQTFGVHSRGSGGLGPVGLFALALTVGLGVGSAALHGPILVYLAIKLALYLTTSGAQGMDLLDTAVLLTGWASAILVMMVGARRRKLAVRWRSLALAPIVWGLQSVALLRAIIQLIFAPYQWDKTPHAPDLVADPPRLRDQALDGRPDNGLSGAGETTTPRHRQRGDDPTDSAVA